MKPIMIKDSSNKAKKTDYKTMSFSERLIYLRLKNSKEKKFFLID